MDDSTFSDIMVESTPANKYIGDWYGTEMEWKPYFYEKTTEDPSFWPDSEWRIKAIVDHRPNGGFSMEWAIKEGIVRKVEA